MAASEAAAKSAQPGKKRVNWPVAITEALIRIWEDNLQALRSNTRNAAIYAAMTEQLNAGAGLRSDEESYTAKQILQKLENLNKHYRKLKQSGTTTGSKDVEWPFYWQLHNFLGSLPINNEFLAEENVERESLICEKDRANRDPLKGFGFRLKQIASQDARKP
ncbi:hypothetical protein HPB47_025080 [Ixodes persulcatus]|uniref:Uncharacterized protein n=1 Tax=Ixodes persulcatus TaxID=34615 RepID=A0AC60Q2U8_IXOPE|nr:hypothetical protein HPB47_025080 [Ixodes persulcatus]